MKVFIGGSRHVTRLPSSVSLRIQNIISQSGTILVGDANGADKAVQSFLSNVGYNHVVVYFVGDAARNNVGAWPTNEIHCESKNKDFYFYACKDLAMSKDADFGLMIWDGKSKGTINNAVNLLREKKLLLLFHVRTQEFIKLSTLSDLRHLLEGLPPSARDKMVQDLSIDEFADEPPQQSLTYDEAASLVESNAKIN